MNSEKEQTKKEADTLLEKLHFYSHNDLFSRNRTVWFIIEIAFPEQ